MRYLIYFTGIIPAYLLLRKSYKIFFDEWTVFGRYACIAFSLFSWIGALTAVVQIFVLKAIKEDNHKPASW